MGELALLCWQWERRVVLLGLCSAVDALAAFGVWGVLMEADPAEDSRPPPRQASPLISVPKARMVPTSAVGGGESLSPIPGLPGVGDGGIRVRGRASLVAQWLRICLPVEGTWVQSLVWEDPTCRGATKPVCHDY